MPHRPPPNALAFKRRLLRWFRSVGRDLPWRRTRDPYRILVSEFMLLQTQVSRVAEFYPRFLAVSPDEHWVLFGEREPWESDLLWVENFP